MVQGNCNTNILQNKIIIFILYAKRNASYIEHIIHVAINNLKSTSDHFTISKFRNVAFCIFCYHLCRVCVTFPFIWHLSKLRNTKFKF